MSEKINLKILRQDSPDSKPYWETFTLEASPDTNVISLLMDIQKKPINANGKHVAPVVWECNCLEHVCGSCSMIINGKVQQACNALIKTVGTNITLKPMSKFPVLRDLRVDRTKLFDNLKKVKAWIPVDGYYDLGAGPRIAPEEQLLNYELSRCMSCGCCLDACPNVNHRSEYMGAAVMAQVVLFNAHPTGKLHQSMRLEQVIGVGGIVDCGNSQNCAEVCPKELPLIEAIAELNKQTTKWGFFGSLKW